jgi:hypothetical protein
VAKVDLLGHAEPIPWEQTAEGLVVTLPEAKPTMAPLSLRIAFSATR